MGENMGTAPKLAQEPSNSSEQLDNPPLRSPWNFQGKQRDWHEVFYDEMHSSSIKSEDT